MLIHSGALHSFADMEAKSNTVEFNNTVYKLYVGKEPRWGTHMVMVSKAAFTVPGFASKSKCKANKRFFKIDDTTEFLIQSMIQLN